MNQYFISFRMFLTLAVGVILLLGCKTTKELPKEDLTLIVLLKKGQNADYLQTAYVDFSPFDIKKSNRTLNEYRVKFNCTAKQKEAVLKKMQNDNMVEKMRISESTGTGIQSNTNQNHSTTSPKEKN